jgi:hypothetical protein
VEVFTFSKSDLCVKYINALLNGGYESHVIDHRSMSHEGLRSYTKAMIYSLANKIQLSVEIKETRSGFVIRRSPEFVQWEYDRKNKNGI